MQEEFKIMDIFNKYVVVVSKTDSKDIRLLGSPKGQASFSEEFYTQKFEGSKTKLKASKYFYLLEL